MQLGERLQKIRSDNNLTQDELAGMLHVTRQTVSNWEHEKSYPDLESLITISEHFNVSVDMMLKEDSKMTNKMDRYIKWAKRTKVIPIIMAVCVWEFLVLEIYLVDPNFAWLFLGATIFSIISCVCSAIVLKMEKSVLTIISTVLCFAGMAHFLLITIFGLLMFTY